MRHALVLAALLLAPGVRPAAAQVVEVPTFVAGTPTFNPHIQDADVAVATDGAMLFIWGEYADRIEDGAAAVHRFSPAGVSLGPVLRADTSAHVFNPVVSSDTRGGYVAGWQWIINGREYEFFARGLGGTGAGVGSDFKVDLENVGPTQSGAVAGLPSGAIYVWRQQNHLWGRLLDTAMQPRGSEFVIGDVGGGFDCDVDRMPDGGFVAVWTSSPGLDVLQSWGRVYGPDGQPRGPAFPVDGTSWVRRVAAGPGGEIAATGYRANPDGTVVGWLRRFSADGAFVGERALDAPDGALAPEADLAFDPQGNLFAVWSVYAIGQPLRPPRARAFGPDGEPLGPAFTFTDEPAYRPRTAWAHDHSFVVGWYDNERTLGAVVSLCTPDLAVCGDGVVVPQCEQCDDGALNSDTRPDACRTDCRRAGCGDGVVDAGETCDDGNTVDGDCCSSTCVAQPDTDGDGICDPLDDCPIFPNPDQTHPEVCEPQPLDRLTADEAARFDDGLEEFAQIETPADGLGPVFNGASCAECHNQPRIGGSSTRFVTRFGRYVGGLFDPMTDHGGTLIQAKGITTDTCSVPGEVVPPEATVSTHRDTPPLFGLGLIDAISDARLLRRADPNDRDHDGISGRASMEGTRVRRFGWKAQVATLAEFSADAYLNEMGITSPTQPNENLPQGGPLVCDTVPDPEDDGSNIVAFTDFMTLLAPLPTGPRTPITQLGKRTFRRLKCGACHLPKLKTGASAIAALRNRRVLAYSDFLLHDMGSLGDGIEQGDASGSEFRTAPLWGVAQSAPYLHDGRAATLEDAIAAHDGEARGSRDRFMALTSGERDALIAFLRAL